MGLRGRRFESGIPYMKVKELIEKLQELDPETRVMTSGYEGGYKDANVSDVCEIALNVHTEWYYGPHEDPDDTYSVPDKSQYQIVKAIIL